MDTLKDVSQQVGQELKARRCELNLSLKEVENATSIRTSFLQGIEEGRVHTLISPIYAQGFVKQYAVFLGLEDKKQLEKLLAHLIKAVPSNTDFAYGLRALEIRGTPQHTQGRFQGIWGWIFIGLGALAVAAVLARYLGLL